jgi:hypothetical protein
MERLTVGVPAHDPRLLTRARPQLMEAAFEAVERSLDEAEGIVREAIRNGDPCQADCCGELSPARDRGETAGRLARRFMPKGEVPAEPVSFKARLGAERKLFLFAEASLHSRDHDVR